MQKFSVRLSHSLRALFALLLSAALVVGCTACEAGESSSKVASAANRVIGFVGVGTSEDGWQAAQEEKTVSGLRSLGMKVIYSPATKLDPQAQINAVNSMVRQKVSALVISAQTTNLWNDTFVAVHNAGIPIILLGRKPVSLKGYLFDAYVGPSASQIGQKLAAWVKQANESAANASEKTTALLLQTPLDSSLSSDVTQSWERSIGEAEPHSVIKTHTVVTSWDKEQTRQEISSALDKTGEIPQVVVAYSDIAASAVVDELTERGVEVSVTPRAGSTCVIALTDSPQNMATLKSGKIARVLSWNSDYSKTLYDTVMEQIAGGSTAKEVNVALKWNEAQSNSHAADTEGAQE